jgi:hypothetical protein
VKKTTTETITRKRADNSPEGFYEEMVAVEVALDGTEIGKSSGPWDTCVLCNYTAPKTDMGYISGRPYCFKYNCFASTAYEETRGE